MMFAIAFYDVIVWVHVTAILLAFGVTFAFPVIDAGLRSVQPRSLPAWWAVRAMLGQRLVNPAATVALLAGVYAASDRDLWSETWVTIPAAILIIIFGINGAVLIPNDKRLAASAERDLEASPGDTVTFSAQTQALEKRAAIAGTIAGVLILVALFFMVTKAGA